MEEPEVTRARRAAVDLAASLGLAAQDAVVLHNSNKLALRLTPCDVVARVTHIGHPDARLELLRAQRLAAAGCPVGVVAPRVRPQVEESDGFAVTLWTWYAPAPVAADDCARALVQLHAGLRTADLTAPRCTERIDEAHRVATDPDLSPELAGHDRELLRTRLAELRRVTDSCGAAEQLLHGEPHPGNVLGTARGPIVIDFETLCRGPVEFDLAHAPEAVCEHHPGLDRELLEVCRELVLAVVAAWRWRIGDDFPDRRRWGQLFLRALRNGPPWPTLDALTRRVGPRPQN